MYSTKCEMHDFKDEKLFEGKNWAKNLVFSNFHLKILEQYSEHAPPHTPFSWSMVD